VTAHGVTAQAEIGARLRRLRQERELSLAHVASATGLSASSLSLVETGKSDIGFGRLKRLIDFYGIRFSDLVPEPPPAEPAVVRATGRRHIASPAEGIDVYLLTHGGERALEPVLAVYEPGGELQPYGAGSPPVERFFLVLDGELELTFEGHPPLTVGAGDAVHHDGGGTLSVRNPGAARAAFVAVAAGPWGRRLP
jgi:transcriptional regulator with XRE-family HTH domain